MNNIKYNVVDDSPFSFQNTFPPASTGASSGSNLSMKSDVTSFDKKIQNLRFFDNLFSPNFDCEHF